MSPPLGCVRESATDDDYQHPSADIYAWGRVTAFMLTGRTTKEAIASLPKFWIEILQPCVDVVPTNRPDAAALRNELARRSG